MSILAVNVLAVNFRLLMSPPLCIVSKKCVFLGRLRDGGRADGGGATDGRLHDRGVRAAPLPAQERRGHNPAGIASHRTEAPVVRCQCREKMKTNLGRKRAHYPSQYQVCYVRYASTSHRIAAHRSPFCPVSREYSTQSTAQKSLARERNQLGKSASVFPCLALVLVSGRAFSVAGWRRCPA